MIRLVYIGNTAVGKLFGLVFLSFAVLQSAEPMGVCVSSPGLARARRTAGGIHCVSRGTKTTPPAKASRSRQMSVSCAGSLVMVRSHLMTKISPRRYF